MRDRGLKAELAFSTNGVIGPGGPYLVDPLVRPTEWKR
jgi:hypothetical protein